MNGRIKRNENVKHLPFGRLGKIKIGMKGPKGYPMSVDYFIPSGKYESLFTRALGDKPNVIQIVFPCDDAELVCNEHYEYRDDKGALVAKGDGETFLIWDGKKYKEYNCTEFPNLMQGLQEKHPNKTYQRTGDGWSATLEMNFIIPAISGVVGLWNFQTKGGASTIPQLREAFDSMLELNGFVKGVIFDLSVSFAKSQKPGVKTRYPVVSMIVNESAENIKKFENNNLVKRLE